MGFIQTIFLKSLNFILINFQIEIPFHFDSYFLNSHFSFENHFLIKLPRFITHSLNFNILTYPS